MTTQRSDHIRYMGEMHPLFSTPMSSAYLKDPESEDDLWLPISSASIRGYVAYWEVTGVRLFLVGFDDHGVSLSLPPPALPLFAGWYSGELRIQAGEVSDECANDQGYGPTFSEEIVLSVENGLVTSKEIVPYCRPESFRISQLDL